MSRQRERVAVIGAGISGLTVARLLRPAYDVVVLEASDRVGGHALTTVVPDRDGNPLRVDAGVCMFYSTGYPRFFEMLRLLKVPLVRSEITVEFHFLESGQRYYLDMNAPWRTAASSLWHRSQHWLVQDGLRFYRHARSVGPPSPATLVRPVGSMENADTAAEGPSLGEYLAGESYSEEFRVLLSFLCGATWTLNQKGIDQLPLSFVIQNMRALGFLPSIRHGVWHHVPGSVGRYLDALAAPMREQVRLLHEVERVEREPDGVVVYGGGRADRFDQVVFAIPPRAALARLAAPHDDEREVLDAFSSQSHSVVFTSDREAVGAWSPSDVTLFAATDGFNRSLAAGKEFVFRAGFANLTKMCGYPTADPLYMWYQFPDVAWPRQQFARVDFATPCFNRETVAAQARHAEISGRDRIHFCGASWVNGIHEGGVVSALRVAERLGCSMSALESGS
ncbi:MAG: FAD-dependent oxidoreductase [Planctomycetales bacterium]|nr:FAD-dependent oxidoreductase [Planctomycetales bacterium]